MITKFEKYNEGLIEDFHFDEVKKYVQTIIKSGGLHLYNIVPERYFIIATDNDNKVVGGTNTLSKDAAVGIINEFKKNEFIFKIYVEKPKVGAQLYLKTDNKWNIQNINLKDKLNPAKEEEFKYRIDFVYYVGKEKYKTHEFFGSERYFNNYIRKVTSDEKYRKFIGHTKYKNVNGQWIEVD